ncbi:dephospho-CoA kinase [Taibaiella koreensis]|uniref:dephospho-CoA kinase n=1 Tax=Taibaiella koreensis TaxID=1268548 RepID=UPI000E59E691|nr:dephospho-CoA kinase [Taibaiella koreensis]
MLKVGLTGGIGSGKSLVAELFSLLGVPVLHADDTAKYLMEHDARLRQEISRVFGEEAYQNGRLNRPFLASMVFGNEEKLRQLNGLVHPATIAYSNAWAQKQQAPYVLKEAAIFFESGSDKEMDKMIGVYAPYSLRLQRAMQRDNAGEEAIKARMDKQMNEEEKMSRCDHIIRNDGTLSVIEQVLALDKLLRG